MVSEPDPAPRVGDREEEGASQAEPRAGRGEEVGKCMERVGLGQGVGWAGGTEETGTPGF